MAKKRAPGPGRQLAPRRQGDRKPRPSMLICCEGTETERQYFDEIKAEINAACEGKRKGNMDVVPVLDVKGAGKGTMELVKEADKLVRAAQKKSHIPFAEVCLILDKDNFTDFDKAIAEAEKRGMRPVWSNPSFEYWLCLHFEDSHPCEPQKEYERRIQGHFADHKINGGKYDKSYRHIFTKVREKGNMVQAIKRAKRQQAMFDRDKVAVCSKRLPATEVHKLVEELMEYL